MKVVRNNRKDFVDFEDLLEYEFFSDEEGCVYLKIPKVTDDNKRQTANAINLEDNRLTYFCVSEKIKILDCEIIVQN